jgi:sugar/nucleoside kinase (ribokinase family)
MIIKCNNIEAVKLFNSSDSQDINCKAFDLTELGKSLRDFAKSRERPVFITCGSEGVMVLDGQGQPVLVPAVPLPVETKIDIVGAGDACSSGIVTALSSGAIAQEAAFMGNLVASITIQIIGTTGTATRGQVIELYDNYYGKG